MTKRSTGRGIKGPVWSIIFSLAGFASFCAAHVRSLAFPPQDRPAQKSLSIALQERVAVLEKKRDELFEAGEFSAAVDPAREILGIRSASQPAQHWEVRTASEHLRSCKRLSAIPQDQRKRIKTAWDSCSRASEESAARRFDRAEPIWRQALDTFREVLGEQDVYTLVIENELGFALYHRGFCDAAAAVFRKELTGYRQLFDELHPDTAMAHDNLAMSLHALGDDDAALDHGTKALETYIRLTGATSENTATSCNDTGLYLESLGEYEQAEKMYRLGLEIRRKILGEENLETARSYNNVAVLLFNRGSFAQSADLNRKALAIRCKVVEDPHPDIARSRDNLANCLDEQGNFAEAEKLHRLALATRLQILGKDHSDTVLSLNNLGYNLRAQGRDAEAEATWAKAAAGFERARSRVASAGLDRAAFSAARSPLIALAVILAGHNKPKEAWERLESNLGRALFDELTARDAQPLQRAEQQQQQELLEKLQAIDEKITAEHVQPNLPQRPLEQLKAEKDRLQADLDTFDRGLARKYGVASGQVYGLERIQRQLAPDVAMAAWVDLDLPRRSPDWNKEHWACLVRSEGTPTWVRLTGSGPGGDWTVDDQTLPLRLRQMVANPPGPRAEEWRDIAGHLALQRLSPLREQLQARGTLPAVRHLVVLPSRALEGVPVEILLDAWEAQNRPQTVSYIPSGTIYAWLRQRRVERNLAGRSGGQEKLLAIGNPVSPRSAAVAQAPTGAPDESIAGLVSVLNRRRNTLGSLPGTEKEIKAIAGLFKTPAPTLLLGVEANESNLKKLARDGAMRQFDVIHLATHGKIDGRAPMRSALLLSAQTMVRTPDAKEWGDEDGDGLITAGQILRTWKLDADLVTLSACQTALGKTSGGDGQIGFAQALFRAGSQSLILSLWKVDDEATAMVMTDFYRGYTNHVEPDHHRRRKADALQRAKSELRKVSDVQRTVQVAKLSRGPEVEGADATKRGRKRPYDHPYYWAGFVLIGDPE